MITSQNKMVLISIPMVLMPKIDDAVRQLYITRTHFIRESIRRNLNYFEFHERAVAREMTKRAYEPQPDNSSVEDLSR
jgi:metal-responsive CopG/Arc/MetJ family transcriptional regulator